MLRQQRNAQLKWRHAHAGGFVVWAGQDCTAACRLLLVSLVVSFRVGSAAAAVGCRASVQEGPDPTERV